MTDGANMSTTPEGVALCLASGILYGPGKAANAGGVAVSGLEMVQDSERLQWTSEEVDSHLRSIMMSIHSTVRETAEEHGRAGDYVSGANIAGFVKVSGAMLDEQVV